MVRSLAACALLMVAAGSAWSCRAESKPNCDRMRACCAALRGVENGLPKEHEILCAHNPEYDEGCVDTVSDIVKFTPAKNLPAACKLQP